MTDTAVSNAILFVMFVYVVAIEIRELLLYYELSINIIWYFQSSRTKTLTDTTDSASTLNPLVRTSKCANMVLLAIHNNRHVLHMVNGY